MQSDGYVFSGDAEAQRLAILADVTARSTKELLRQASVTPGMRCLDVGCGKGDVTKEIARMVSPEGVVVGLDANPHTIAATRLRDPEGLVDFRLGSWEELTDEPAYDLVYTRFLLTHCPDPMAVIEKLTRQLKPGGALVAEDIDFDGHFAYPPSPAFDRYLVLYKEAVTQLGGDPCIGPKLLGYFQDTGLKHIEQEVVLPTFHSGPGKTLARLALIGIQSKLLDLGLATSDEIDQLLAELEAFEANPRSMNSIPRIHQVWGMVHAS